MITLTTPPTINTVLGGATPVAYQKTTLTNLHVHPPTRRIEADVQMVSTTVPEMPAMLGSLTIDLVGPPPVLIVTVPQLNFYRRLLLTAGQITAVQTIIDNTVNPMEAGLVSLALVAGVQTAGI